MFRKLHEFFHISDIFHLMTCLCIAYRKTMAVIHESGRRCRRNGMANIFTGIDTANLEYLSSLAGAATAGATSSVPNSNPVGIQNSNGVASLNFDQHSSDNENDSDSDGNESQDHHRWCPLPVEYYSEPSVWVFGTARKHGACSPVVTVCRC